MSRVKKVLHLDQSGQWYDKILKRNMKAKGYLFYSPLLNALKVFTFKPELKGDGYVLSAFFSSTGVRRTRYYYIGDV